jgi:hypothetical protein
MEGKSGGRRIAIKVPEPLTQDEKDFADQSPRIMRDWPPETDLRYLMDMRARHLAERGERTVFARKFSGAMGEGPDWRRTIRSMARGENEIYVRHTRGCGREARKSLVTTPVVWIFDDQTPIIYATSENYTIDGVSSVVGMHYCIEHDYIAESRIGRLKRAAFSDLGAGRGYLGLARSRPLTGDEEREIDKAYLAKLPAEKRCYGNPRLDDELEPFAGTDHAIAFAIKYADDEIILVSRSGLPISVSVAKYAQERKVRIRRVSVDNFGAKRLARFQDFHWTPVPGDAYEKPFEWCARFVPEI